MPQARIQQFLMIDLSLAKQNRPSMQFLLSIFGCFAASLIGLLMLLRFEPNLRFPLLGS